MVHLHRASVRFKHGEPRTKKGVPKVTAKPATVASNRDPLRVKINGDPRQLPANCTLASLLSQLEVGERRVAVAINRDVIPRSEFDALRLRDGDNVEVLEAVGGG